MTSPPRNHVTWMLKLIICAEPPDSMFEIVCERNVTSYLGQQNLMRLDHPWNCHANVFTKMKRTISIPNSHKLSVKRTFVWPNGPTLNSVESVMINTKIISKWKGINLMQKKHRSRNDYCSEFNTFNGISMKKNEIKNNTMIEHFSTCEEKSRQNPEVIIITSTRK